MTADSIVAAINGAIVAALRADRNLVLPTARFREELACSEDDIDRVLDQVERALGLEIGDIDVLDISTIADLHAAVLGALGAEESDA